MPGVPQEVEDAVQQLRSPAMDKLVHYVNTRLQQQVARCVTSHDETSIRRAQGAAAELNELVEVLNGVPPVPARRAKSRQEV